MQPLHLTMPQPPNLTVRQPGEQAWIATHQMRVTEHGTSCRNGCVSAGSRCNSVHSCISRAILAHRQHRDFSVQGGQLLPQALQQLALQPAGIHPTQAGILQVRPLRQHQASASRSASKVLSDKLIEWNNESLHICWPNKDLSSSWKALCYGALMHSDGQVFGNRQTAAPEAVAVHPRL